MSMAVSQQISEFVKRYTPEIVGGGILIAATLGGIVAYKKMMKVQSELSIAPVGVKTYRSRGASQIGRQVYPGRFDEEKNPQPGVFILHKCPRGRKTPCIAPYPLKLETFLRVHGIRYEVEFDTGNSPKTGGHYTTIEIEDIVDSQNCIKFLCETFDIFPDEHLTEDQQIFARAYNHLLENHLYWGIVLYRWVYNSDPGSLKKIQYWTPQSEASIPKVRDTLNRAAWFHGIGKFKESEVTLQVIKDIESLSKLLGSKKFFLNNEKPSELDCTAFGMLAQMLWTMEDSPYFDAITNKFSNLQTFCMRMKKEYWPDWDKCLLNTPIESEEK